MHNTVTALVVEDTTIFVRDETGARHKIIAHRASCWNQGIVIMPESFSSAGAVLMSNMNDEESAMIPLPHAINHRELANLHKRWAAGELPSGEYPLM